MNCLSQMTALLSTRLETKGRGAAFPALPVCLSSTQHFSALPGKVALQAAGLYSVLAFSLVQGTPGDII